MSILPALSALDELHEIFGIAAILGSVAIALAFGRTPWRLAGLIMLADTAAFWGLAAFVDRADRVPLLHARAVLIAILYAFLVARFGGRGLVILLSLQMVAVLFHLSAWFDRSILSSINALVLNGVGWAMLLTLVLGAVASRRASEQTID